MSLLLAVAGRLLCKVVHVEVIADGDKNGEDSAVLQDGAGVSEHVDGEQDGHELPRCGHYRVHQRPECDHSREDTQNAGHRHDSVDQQVTCVCWVHCDIADARKEFAAGKTV